MVYSVWHELPGSHKEVARGARVGDKAAGDTTIQVTLYLQPKKALSEPPEPARRISRADYAARHGADPAAVQAVKAFAAHFGLKVSEVLRAQCCMILTGRVNDFERAFEVELHSHRFGDGTSYRGRVGSIKVPKELHGIVTSVFGLDNRAAAWTPNRRSAVRTKEPATAAVSFQTKGKITAFYPHELGRLYNFPSDVTGDGERIGIVEIGGGYTASELTTYFKQAGAAKCPEVSVRPVKGGSTNKPAPSGGQNTDLEVLADIEIAGSLAPGAKIFMYFAKDGSEEQIVLALSAAIHDKDVDLSVLSLSFVGAEYESPRDATGVTVSSQYQDTVNRLFQSAAHLGITVCAASGDHGSAGYPANNPQVAWDGKAHVGFPASSPFVLACGGTHILKAVAGHPKEEVWHSGDNVGSGGGISRYFALPSYQKGTVTQRAVNPEGSAGRGVPDVSANAAPQSGYRVLCDGTWYPGDDGKVMPGGGTSAAAPLWAALIALINQSLRVRVGFVNPLLYEIGALSDAFFDIVKGNNGDYRACVGWDPCTGLGSPNGSDLRDRLKTKLALG